MSGVLSGSGERMEYYFNKAGYPLQERIIGENDVHILDWAIENLITTSRLWREKIGERFGHLDLAFTYRNGETKTNSPSDLVKFEEENLKRVQLAGIFPLEKEVIEAPPIAVYSRLGRISRTEDWDFSVYDVLPQGLKLSKKEEPNTAIFSDEKGEVFRVEVQVGKKESEDGSVISVLKVIESHIPTGRIKIVEAPLQVNMQKVSEGFLDQNADGEPSWRRMGQLIGARVSIVGQKKS